MKSMIVDAVRVLAVAALLGAPASGQESERSPRSKDEPVVCEPPAPSSPIRKLFGFNFKALTRSLEDGLEQNRGKPAAESWAALHTLIQRTLTCNRDLPKGIRVTLTAVRDASYDKKYERAHFMLHHGIDSVAQHAEDLAKDRPFWRCYVGTGLHLSNSRDTEGIAVLRTFAKVVQEVAPELIPSPQHVLTLRAAAQASEAEMGTWLAYNVLYQSIQTLYDLRSYDLAFFYFQLALYVAESPALSPGAMHHILRTYVERAVTSALLSKPQLSVLEKALTDTRGVDDAAAIPTLRQALKTVDRERISYSTQ
jgi:hypothetical protein